MSSLPETKTCSQCKQEKPITEYQRHAGNRDGLRGQCRGCRTEIQREYISKNHEYWLNYWRSYQDANRERYQSHSRRHYKQNREYYRNYSKANRGKFREYSRRSYYKNKARYLASDRRWRRNNPTAARAIIERYRARKLGAVGTYTAAEFDALCRQYDSLCACCGMGKPLTVDHIVPLSCGGSNDISNIQPLCQSCNSSKGTKTIDYRQHPTVVPLRQLRMFD